MDAQKLVSILCYVGAVVCAVLAFGALSRDEDEIADYADMHLPPDAFLIQSRIGHDYGVFAAIYLAACRL
jgi:hypothetical protein